MGENFILLNKDKWLHDLRPCAARDLSKSIDTDWEKIARHVWNSLNKPPAEIENLIAKLRNERDPAFEFFKIFGRRGVKLAHLLETFKQMNFEFCENGGLKLVKKQSSQENIPLTINDLEIKTSPLDSVVPYGATINLEVNVKVKNRPNGDHTFSYQWFKKTNNNFEAVKNNITSQTRKLVIQNATEEDGGYYACQIIDNQGSINLLPNANNPCKVAIKLNSNYDLKIALLIGNGYYNRIPDCFLCKCISSDDSLSFDFIDLTVVDDLISLKTKLEEMNFEVMSYVDLDTDGYLRVIKLLKELCEKTKSKNVYLFAYVGGHGVRVNLNDVLIPADCQTAYMHKFHVDPRKSPMFTFSSLGNLVKMFNNSTCNRSDYCKFSLNCFWDLCRVVTTYNQAFDPFSEYSGELDYNIVYSCSVDKYAYENANGKKGSIVLNSFLENCTHASSINDILVDINNDIKNMKINNQRWQTLEQLKLHSSISKEFSDFPFGAELENPNEQVKVLLNSLYYQGDYSGPYTTASCIKIRTNKPEQKSEYTYHYRFIRDAFLNTLLFEFSLGDGLKFQFDEKQENLVLNPDIDLHYEIVNMTSPYKVRIKALHLLNNKSLEMMLKFRTSNEDERVHGRVVLENSDLKVCKELYEKPIDEYVNEMHMKSFPDPVTESESCYSTNSYDDLSKQFQDFND